MSPLATNLVDQHQALTICLFQLTYHLPDRGKDGTQSQC